MQPKPAKKCLIGIFTRIYYYENNDDLVLVLCVHHDLRPQHPTPHNHTSLSLHARHLSTKTKLATSAVSLFQHALRSISHKCNIPNWRRIRLRSLIV